MLIFSYLITVDEVGTRKDLIIDFTKMNYEGLGDFGDGSLSIN